MSNSQAAYLFYLKHIECHSKIISFHQTGMFYYIQAFLCLNLIRMFCCEFYHSQLFLSSC